MLLTARFGLHLDEEYSAVPSYTEKELIRLHSAMYV